MLKEKRYPLVATTILAVCFWEFNTWWVESILPSPWHSIRSSVEAISCSKHWFLLDSFGPVDLFEWMPKPWLSWSASEIMLLSLSLTLGCKLRNEIHTVFKKMRSHRDWQWMWQCLDVSSVFTKTRQHFFLRKSRVSSPLTSSFSSSSYLYPYELHMNITGNSSSIYSDRSTWSSSRDSNQGMIICMTIVMITVMMVVVLV